MAEVYGVKPKKFTREWWPYYWMYYKWHTIIIGFFSICAITFVAQCAMQTKYDLNVTYAGRGFYESEVTAKLADAISAVAVDADGNDQTNVFVEQLNFSGGTNAEMDYTLQMKHDVEMTQDTYMLYLYDREQADIMLSRDQSEHIYADVREWAKADIADDMLLCADDGTPVMVCLKDNGFLRELGMDASDLYIAVRALQNNKELAVNAHKSAVNAANLILGK